MVWHGSSVVVSFPSACLWTSGGGPQGQNHFKTLQDGTCLFQHVGPCGDVTEAVKEDTAGVPAPGNWVTALVVLTFVHV